MAQMKEVKKRTRKAKESKTISTTIVDGVKITICKPSPAPKLVTARH